jgi:hypothetical protein
LDEYREGEWMIRFSPGEKPVVCDRDENPIATIHGSEEEALKRALLIAKAPSLRDAVKATIQVFSVMRDRGTERERATAEDMLPALEAAVYLLEE